MRWGYDDDDDNDDDNDDDDQVRPVKICIVFLPCLNENMEWRGKTKKKFKMLMWVWRRA